MPNFWHCIICDDNDQASLYVVAMNVSFWMCCLHGLVLVHFLAIYRRSRKKSQNRMHARMVWSTNEKEPGTGILDKEKY